MIPHVIVKYIIELADVFFSGINRMIQTGLQEKSAQFLVVVYLVIQDLDREDILVCGFRAVPFRRTLGSDGIAPLHIDAYVFLARKVIINGAAVHMRSCADIAIACFVKALFIKKLCARRGNDLPCGKAVFVISHTAPPNPDKNVCLFKVGKTAHNSLRLCIFYCNICERACQSAISRTARPIEKGEYHARQYYVQAEV